MSDTSDRVTSHHRDPYRFFNQKHGDSQEISSVYQIRNILNASQRHKVWYYHNADRNFIDKLKFECVTEKLCKSIKAASGNVLF